MSDHRQGQEQKQVHEAGDWELSEDFYKEASGNRELNLEDFMDDSSEDLDADSGLGNLSPAGEDLKKVAAQVEQVIQLTGQGMAVSEIAGELGMEESYVHDIMVCVQAFPEDNPMAVARLIVMG